MTAQLLLLLCHLHLHFMVWPILLLDYPLMVLLHLVPILLMLGIFLPLVLQLLHYGIEIILPLVVIEVGILLLLALLLIEFLLWSIEDINYLQQTLLTQN